MTITCSPNEISSLFVVSIKRFVLIAVRTFSKMEKEISKVPKGNRLVQLLDQLLYQLSVEVLKDSLMQKY